MALEGDGSVAEPKTSEIYVKMEMFLTRLLASNSWVPVSGGVWGRRPGMSGAASQGALLVSWPSGGCLGLSSNGHGCAGGASWGSPGPTFVAQSSKNWFKFDQEINTVWDRRFLFGFGGFLVPKWIINSLKNESHRCSEAKRPRAAKYCKYYYKLNVVLNLRG